MTNLVPQEPSEIPPNIQKLIEKINFEIEQGKKLSFWNIGKGIKEDILENADKAKYGDYLYKTLSEKTKIGRTNLYLSVQFYQEYPEIVHLSGRLTWTHYKTLLAIPEKATRQAYEEEIIQKDLTVDDLKALISQNKGVVPNEAPLLPANRTAPYVYRLKAVRGESRLDLGFNIYLPASSDLSNVQVGDVHHYTYKAYVLEIVDGDTLWVDIDLGFPPTTVQKLRLRGVDAPEMGTTAGQVSKEYVSNCLKDSKFIAIKTYWRDKFDRYLVDIFYDAKEADLDKLIAHGTFLNQELLDKGLAVRY